MWPQMPSRSTCTGFARSSRIAVRRLRSRRSAGWATSYWRTSRRPSSVFRFKSILSRILFLHVVALVITAICLPLALYWFLKSDVENLQRRALQGQAEALANHLTARAGGEWSFDLPVALRDQYSEAYGRYAYAVLDDTGRVLFSSRREARPIFPVDAQSTE